MDQARDEASFDHYFDAAWPALQGQAYVLTGSRELAQDLAQEALVRTWRNWDTVSRLDSPEGWTRKVLHNLCIESWRKTRRRPPTPETAAHAEIPESHGEIAEAMRSLPERHAKALLLHDGLGMTVVDVAVELEVPEGTVKSWLSRSRKVVAQRLEHLEHDPMKG